MAQLAVHGNWKSVGAQASMLVFFGVLAYGIAASISHDTVVSLGLWPYLTAIAAIFFGFWSKEDHVAIIGIGGINVVIILDVLLRVGVLGFNSCPEFSVWTGC